MHDSGLHFTKDSDTVPEDDCGRMPPQGRPDEDAALLDAYSRAVIGAADEVVGVNTAVILPAQGLCFAVGINAARSVVDQLARHGRVRRAHLGVSGQTVSLARAAARGPVARQRTGLLVLSVQAESPADRADVLPGDVIVTFNGQPVAGVDDLHRLLLEDAIGVRAFIRVLRGREEIEMEILPEEGATR